MLYDIQNNLITNKISNVLPDTDIVKVKNRLIDGTFHSQTIGNPLTILDITCNLNEAGRNMLCNAFIVDMPLRLEWYNKYYIGLIHENPKWTIYVKGNDTKRVYEAQFRLAVSEEGYI